MTALEWLAAIEDIRQLKARYFRLLDTKDWDQFVRLFTVDAVFDMSAAAGAPADAAAIVTGAANIAAFVSAAVDTATTVHHGHTAEIELTSPTTASAIWPMEDQLRWPATVAGALKAMHGYGHYRDTYELVGGRWCIKSSALSRLLLECEYA